MTDVLRAARICIHAPITSFRYPHFLIGRQVTFDLPPPSTIYGHVASAMGEWPDPASLRFGYHFTFVSKGSDLEHQHIIWPGRPSKLSKEESAALNEWQKRNPIAVGGAVQPAPREFVFQAELTLYLQPVELVSAFRSPAFPVILGRSQDLACLTSVEEVELADAPGAYFENTLLPYSWRTKTGFGTTVLMSRYITPPPDRDPTFERYVALRRGERVFGGRSQIEPGSPRRLLEFDGETREWLVDPSSPSDYGVHRGITFLSFVD